MGPGFLCIGAQRAGTSWLYHNLRPHPQVWLPPHKEIHYFDVPGTEPLILTKGSSGTKNRVRRGLGRALRPDNWGHAAWYIRYFGRSRNDAWYLSLSQPGAGQVAGDITPGYARLDEAGVARVHTLLPEAKILYLLRNPVHRAWSQFCYMGPHQSHASDEALMARWFSRRAVDQNADYVRVLALWESYYLPQRVFVGFYDQLVEAPGELLLEVCHFLEIDDSPSVVPSTVKHRRNAGRSRDMPEYTARHLSERYYDRIVAAHQRFGNEYTARWLAYAQEHMEA